MSPATTAGAAEVAVDATEVGTAGSEVMDAAGVAAGAEALAATASKIGDEDGAATDASGTVS